MDIISSLTALFGSAVLFLSSLLGSVGAAPVMDTVPVTPQPTVQATSTIKTQASYSNTQLLSLAGDSFASGTVPLGDYKYVTASAKKGYVYLCNARKDTGGAMADGPWVNGSMWNFKNKLAVSGSVLWKNASFKNATSSSNRVLSGNDLPLSHATGVFPIAQTDPAHAYDANPNSIKAQTMKTTLPLHPVYSDTPYCMGGEVGVMLTGVPLFNAFDAGLRDAPAHELQDSCRGHPQVSGEYHYHSLPSCLKDTAVSTVIGFAYDGFPITGPVVEKGKYLTTKDLDECHGLTSDVVLDGKKTITYHYVMTYDFPYSASCFRGKPISTGPSASGNAAPAAKSTSMPPATDRPAGTPPQAALDACSSKSSGVTCSFTGGRGETVSGTCSAPPAMALACVPQH